MISETMPMQPAIYIGHVQHRRRSPAQHEFNYSLFMVMLDVDRIDETLGKSRFTSRNRFNWASFYDSDHFGDPSESLRRRLAKDAEQNGLSLPEGPIFLLTQLRYLGYCFNPISFYYCFDRNGALALVMAEVSSTFGETANYWLHPGAATKSRSGSGLQQYRVAKQLHVSPFMGMDVEYEFNLTSPSQTLTAHIANVSAEEGRFFDATLTLTRLPWTAATLMRTLRRHPWMTAKTILAIHFEAIRLYFKNIPFHRHPAVAKAAAATPEVRQIGERELHDGYCCTA